MDTIVKQSWYKKNKTWVNLLVIFLSICFIAFWFAFSNSVPTIDLNKVTISSVKYGDFQEIIVANGSIEPKTTVLIDANEGGTVKSIKFEEGSTVKKGDVILSLTNEAVMLDYMQRETQMVEQINNMRNTRINLHQNLRTTEDQLSEFTKELALIEKQFITDSSLLTTNGISKNAFLETKTNYSFVKNKVTTLKNRKATDEIYHSRQIARIDSSIALMERNLVLIREKLNNMTISAPIDGVLNSFNLEPGQVLQQNQTIGRIDVPGKFWIRALVDQHYSNRLNIGQLASINYDGKTYQLELAKVLSTVENGQIEMYLTFISAPPKELRRGQNFQVFVEISAKNKTLQIPRGAFFHSSGGKYVYVLSEDRKKALKKTIIIGRQNPNFYELVEGLSEGQEIITSTYDSFKNNEEIELK